ncbi:MAG: hypothetical protein KDJ75_05765 [Alphaproteobacteria bacterium]|nr:hypothetical protein [Alphaproteobacteria bacterium]
MDPNSLSLSLHFSPLLPGAWLPVALTLGTLILLLSLWKNKRSWLLRLISFAAFLLVLLNPAVLRENRQSVPDTALIVVDQSASQTIGKRKERTDAALAHLQDALSRYDTLNVRIVHAPADGTLAQDTKLFGAIEQALSDVPPARRAGVIFLTDGQIRDVPDNPDLYEQFGPVHALLSGEKDETDRRLKVLEAPAFGIAGQPVTLKYIVEDEGVRHNAPSSRFAVVTIDDHNAPPQTVRVPVGTAQSVNIKLTHAGQNVVEISAAPLPGEITQANNRSAVLVNGVRDRLRVLLVSGKPHAGGRTWRDLLTADPGVDLVHFTILREPEKLDSTPQNEMSLIAFPFRELFEVKLYEFDLIIFDRYRLNHILPPSYFSNIAKYVEDGGALLEAGGPSFAGEDSLYNTALKSILPGAPAGTVIETPYRPSVTPEGRYHPVTQDLAWPSGPEGWGRWLRQIPLSTEKGDVLMSGVEERPLLILDRVGKGRVAQLASDQIWLWSRGYEGGGPHAELLRRIVHWLMKEPELDEKALNVHVNGNRITVESRDHETNELHIPMQRPDGRTEKLTLSRDKNGFLRHSLMADMPGLYSFGQGENKRFALVGAPESAEFQDIRTSEVPLSPLVKTSGGGFIWLEEAPDVRVQYAPPARRYAGRDWIALRKNNAFTVQDVRETPLLPAWLSTLLLLGLVVLTWWREGHSP